MHVDDANVISLDWSSSPLPEEASVEEMCAKFALGEDILERLEKLRFHIGDDLSILTKEKWMAAGFTDFEWNRVKRAHPRYKCMLKNSV